MHTFNVNVPKAGFKVGVTIDGATVAIDGKTLPGISFNRAVVYGITQLISDAAASVPLSVKVEGRKVKLKGKELAAAQVKAGKKARDRISDLVNGILVKARESSVDPVEARAKKLATATIQKDDGPQSWRAWCAGFGLKVTDSDATAELTARVAELVAEDPDYLEMAEDQIAAEAKLAAKLSAKIATGDYQTATVEDGDDESADDDDSDDDDLDDESEDESEDTEAA